MCFQEKLNGLIQLNSRTMPQEIERKFLLANDSWKHQVSKSFAIRQGFLSTEPSRTVRIRQKGDRGFLTIKGITTGVSRAEFEYDIPLPDALQLLDLCLQPIIDKTRYIVEVNGNTWEIDVFAGANDGLVIAEIELESEEQEFLRPDWLGQEVSDDPRYYNSMLAQTPFTAW